MTLFLSDHTCLLMAPQKVANHRFSFKAGPPAEGRCFAKQRKLFEAAGDRWIGRTQFIDIGLKNRMLKTSKQFFPFWPSARSYPNFMVFTPKITTFDGASVKIFNNFKGGVIKS